MKTYFYSLFGLKLESELELPELPLREFKDVDVQIRIGENPIHLPVIGKKGVLFETSNNDFLFRFPSVGSFRVQNGNLITIDPNTKAIHSEILLFLLGSTMGALLHQRQILSLHGSTIVIDNKAITFVGNSSVGKSSLAASFASMGYKILSDDITALMVQNNNHYEVLPGLPHIKLWKDVVNHLKSEDKLEKVRPSINKYIKPLENSYQKEPVRLKAIICLGVKNTSGYTTKPRIGVEKFNQIKNQIYRSQYIFGDINIKNHFNRLANLSNHINVFQIDRPENPLQLFEFAEYVKGQVIKLKL